MNPHSGEGQPLRPFWTVKRQNGTHPVFMFVDLVSGKSQVGEADLHEVELRADFVSVVKPAKETFGDERSIFDFDQANVKMETSW